MTAIQIYTGVQYSGIYMMLCRENKTLFTLLHPFDISTAFCAGHTHSQPSRWPIPVPAAVSAVHLWPDCRPRNCPPPLPRWRWHQTDSEPPTWRLSLLPSSPSSAKDGRLFFNALCSTRDIISPVRRVVCERERKKRVKVQVRCSVAQRMQGRLFT